MTDPGKGANTATVMHTASTASASSDQDVFASSVVSHKRPRSSPESSDAATGSRNPFATYGHFSRPPPPSPSSRLGVNVGLPASGVDLSQDGGEDTACAAVTPAFSRTARGTPETSSRGRDGSVSSPALLVDLSQADEEGEDAEKLENVHGESEELRDSPPRPEALTGTATRGGDDSPSLMLSSTRRSSVDGIADSEHAKSVAKGGREDQEAEEQLLASKLFFVVSCNTGRVHVYKKEEQEDDSSGFDYGFDDEEETKPRHCRSDGCRFGYEIDG